MYELRHPLRSRQDRTAELIGRFLKGVDSILVNETIVSLAEPDDELGGGREEENEGGGKRRSMKTIT